MKIQNMHQAGAAVEAAKAYYRMRVEAACDKLGSANALDQRIGLSPNSTLKALKSRSLKSLRRIAELAAVEGL